MQNVIFEGDQETPRASTVSPAHGRPAGTGMTGLVLRLHLARDEHSANEALVAASLVILAMTGILLFYTFAGASAPSFKPQYREDISPEVRAKLPPGVYETIKSRYER